MASTTTMTSSLPQGSLKLAFAKLDDDIYASLAASQPGSPALGATKPSSQPHSEIPYHSPLSSQPTSAPAAAPAPAAVAPTSTPKHESSSSRTAPVLTLLTTPNLTASTIAPLTTSDATFLCPHWNIPESEKRSRRHSSQAHTGPEAIARTFGDMRQHRSGLTFDVETSFANGEDVAVFGHVQWESRHLGRRVRMPFAVWAKVNEGGRVEFIQIVGE